MEAEASVPNPTSNVEEEEEEHISDTESQIIINHILNTILKKDISDSNFKKNEVDPVALIAMADRCDREKLVNAHVRMQLQRRDTMRKNELLKRNLLKHFRIKKVYRAYSADNPELVNELYGKYRDGLDQLDTIIASLSQLRDECGQKLLDIHEQREQMVAAKTENLEVLIKEIEETTRKLQSSQTGHYLPEQDLKRFLYRMDNVRQRISEVRLLFIKTIDKHTEIDNLAKSLEDLGGGLRMIDFEQLRAERQSLADKIEERNNELARLRLRCNGDTQILAHVREKEFMVGNFITKEAYELDMYQEEMSTCRNFVNQRKSERDQIRRSFAQLSHSVGLLDKPALLVDYDKLELQIAAKEKEIERLRHNIQSAGKRMDANLKQLAVSAGTRSRTSQRSVEAAAADAARLKLQLRLPWVREGVPFKRNIRMAPRASDHEH